MAIRINQNLISLLIQRNLGKVTSKLESSSDHLTSGEKIRRSADDPAGLATSQQIRYEIRGLQRNEQNIGSSLSLLGVAETSFSTIQEQLQKARELAVQAANDTLSANDRQAIDQQFSQIVDEIDRISKNAEFLGRKLLDGSFQSQNVQIGTRSGQTLSLSIRNFQKDSLAVIAQATGQNGSSGGPIVGGGDLVIKGVDVPASTLDKISYIDPGGDVTDESAIAKANAINAIRVQTGVLAIPGPTEFVDAGSAISAATINGSTTTLKINGEDIGPVSFLNGDAGGDLVRAINAKSNLTGVTASVEAGGELKLTADDGRNIDIETTGSIADELGLAPANGDLDTVAFGKITLQGDDPFSISGTIALIGFDASQSTINLDPTTALQTISATSAGKANDSLEVIDAAIRQIGVQRSNLGAFDNRLNGMLDDVARRIEELTASDSRIRDTDFAVETANLVRSQILQDAAVSLLVQANIAPRNALALLQR